MDITGNGNNKGDDSEFDSLAQSPDINHENLPKDAWITLAILSVVGLLVMYGETIVIPAIPDLITDFNITYNTSSWILTAYLVTGAIMIPIGGKLSDIYGKKKMLFIVMSVFAVGTLIGGMSTSFSFLIMSRVLQGVGLAILPVALSLIREKFSQRKIAIGDGIFTAFYTSGAVMGLVIGGLTIEYFGWRATFFLMLPIVVGMLVPVNKFIYDTSKEKQSDNKLSKNERTMSREFDFKGTITLGITILSFLITLTMLAAPENKNIENTPIIIFPIVTIICLCVFIRVEKRSKFPLIDLGLLRHEILLPIIIVILSLGIPLYMIYHILPILIRSPAPVGFEGGSIDAASVQLPFMVISLIVSILGGVLISRVGSSKPLVAGGIISTCGFFILFMNHSTTFVISIDLAIIAVGLTILDQAAFYIAIISAPKESSGMYLGTTFLLALVGMSIGPAISGTYLQAFKTSDQEGQHSFPSAVAYDLALLTAAFISVIPVIMSIVATKRIALSKSDSIVY